MLKTDYMILLEQIEYLNDQLKLLKIESVSISDRIFAISQNLDQIKKILERIDQNGKG